MTNKVNIKWYNKIEVIIVKEIYEKSLQKIKNAESKLTIREYNELAKKNKLLSAESLKYISGKKFEELSEELRRA